MRGIEKKIAEEFGICQDEVHKIVSSSYEYLKSLLKNEYTTYEITGLGTLHFLPNMGEKKLREFEDKMDFIENQESVREAINKKLNAKKDLEK